MTGFCCGTTSIIQKAQNEIILIDGYVDVDTLNILAKKNSGVDVKIRWKDAHSLYDMAGK